MGWSRSPRRNTARPSHRPRFDHLEDRQLLSTLPEIPSLDPASVQPASGSYQGPGNGFDALIGASAARSEFKVDGSGLAVAVIDAGANYNLSALGGGYGAGKKVVGGYDFADRDADPIATNLPHGTAVAGLIASADPTYPGVAPGAEVVALRVFDDRNKSDFGWVADALQWVVDHHDEQNISVVNISLSDGRNYTRNWFAGDGDIGQRITDLVGKLSALNIPVVTATGNSFAGQQGAGFTSIIADTISVTATDASDQLAPDAQRLGKEAGGESATDLAAPGIGLTAPLDSGFASVSGTSYAAPLVSGAILLLQQVYQHRFNALPSVDQIQQWLKSGADPVTDPVTGLTIGRLDIPRAITQIPTPAAQILVPPSPPTPVFTPPAVVVTPPVAESPAATPAPTPPETVPAPTTGTSGGFQVWMNGQPIDAQEVETSAGSTSFLSRVLRSLRDWWTPRSRVRAWVAHPTAEALPRSVPIVAGTEPPPGMPRAWQTFVNGRRTR